jgi:hypothetical protein
MNFTRMTLPIGLAMFFASFLFLFSCLHANASDDGADSHSRIPPAMFRGAEKPDNLVTNLSGLIWGDPAEGFLMSLSLDQSAFKLDTPILLNITLKNISEQDLPWVESRPEHDFVVTVKTAQGDSPPNTLFGEQLIKFGRSSTKRIRLRVAPGEALRYHLDIRRLYDLSSIGEYSVTVQASVWKRGTDSGTVLVSNTVVFRIE